MQETSEITALPIELEADNSSVEGEMDSSEEEEEDEEAIQKVREGFIVDDGEEEPVRKKKKHKRKSVINDALDADDLELLMENNGQAPVREDQFKRLKRAGNDEDANENDTKLADFFSDDEEQDANSMADNDQQPQASGDRNILDEFEDFIEEDEFSDEEEANRQKAQRKQQKLKARPRLDTSHLSNVDRESLQQLFEVFGNGAEYEWALEAQEMEDEGNAENLEPTALEEVFEHAELKQRMLTEEDNLIRIIDIPERFQKYRANLKYVDLADTELKREQQWISGLLLKEKGDKLAVHLVEHFQEAVGKAVEFVSKESMEVPFIWSHRRDFLLYAETNSNLDGSQSEIVHKLLDEDDLWRIVKLDIEYHSLYEKRLEVEKVADQLSQQLTTDDDLLKDISSLDSFSAIQDVHDYIQFTYSKELRTLVDVSEVPADPTETISKEPEKSKKNKFAVYERIKNNILYDAVEAYGITAKQFGENVQDQSSKNFTETFRIHATDDPFESPEDLIEKLCDDDEVLYKDIKNAQGAVRKYYADTIFHNPRIRHEIRHVYKDFAVFSVHVTEKGKTAIDSHSPYYDIKYAVNRSASDLVRYPDMFLRILEAESQGLVVIKIETKDAANWFECIFQCLKSDGLSEISEKWNKERYNVLKMAFTKLTAMIAVNTKEDLRVECERLIALQVRTKFLNRIDQAPLTPFGFDKGTKPSILALSFGKGEFDHAVVGVFVKDSGKIGEMFKSDHNPIRDRESEDLFSGQLKSFIDKALNGKAPDVIVISGYSTHSKRLFDVVHRFVETYKIVVDVDDIPSHVEYETPPLVRVIWGQDETARLYQNSPRATLELSDKATLVKYCVGLARYVQNPLLEYISLGDDILSLKFHDHQHLLANDIVLEAVESAFVDVVNMVGVEINEAIRDDYTSQLLPFVAGLGPRKASGLVRNLHSKLGSSLATRAELVQHEMTTATVFMNCASFLYIPYDDSISTNDGSVELLDATRIHPEDYDLARKMAADALDLDEEDLRNIEEQGGIIYQLIQEGVNKLDELNLNAYGKELATNFGKKKFATLQTIKEELVNNYEELRRSFHILDVQEVFQMLTGETPKSFHRGTVIPVTINKVGRNFRDVHGGIKYLKVITSSLIQGNVDEAYIPRNSQYIQGQVVPAAVVDIQYQDFVATFSLLEHDIAKAFQPRVHKENGKWDFEAEQADLAKEVAKENIQKAKARNFQHNLFHSFNHKQAEEYLAPKNLGDCVLRPSSRGPEFFTVTWKVGTNLFQHLVIEEKTYGAQKKYIVENKTYDDLDELIFMHVQEIAKKVDEMVRHPKFRDGALTEVHEWLDSYTKANPKTSAYIFCYDHKAPGWFLLLFKVNVNTPISTWHVKTQYDGFKLRGYNYPNMTRLCNGFKQLYKHQTRANGNR